jgi:hypothetical protein
MHYELGISLLYPTSKCMLVIIHLYPTISMHEFGSLSGINNKVVLG